MANSAATYKALKLIMITAVAAMTIIVDIYLQVRGARLKSLAPGKMCADTYPDWAASDFDLSK